MLAVISLCAVVRRGVENPVGRGSCALCVKGDGDLLFAGQQAGAVLLGQAQVIIGGSVQIESFVASQLVLNGNRAVYIGHRVCAAAAGKYAVRSLGIESEFRQQRSADYRLFRCAAYGDPAEDGIVAVRFLNGQSYNRLFLQGNGAGCVHARIGYRVQVTEFFFRSAIDGIEDIHLPPPVPPAVAAQHNGVLSGGKGDLIGNVLASPCPPAAGIGVVDIVLAVTGDIRGIRGSHRAGVTPGIAVGLGLVRGFSVQKAAGQLHSCRPGGRLRIVAVDHVLQILRKNPYIGGCLIRAALYRTFYSDGAEGFAVKGYALQIPGNCLLDFLISEIHSNRIRKFRRCSCFRSGIHLFRSGVGGHNCLILLGSHPDRRAVPCPAGHFVSSIRSAEYAVRQIIGSQRIVAASAVVVYQQAVLLGVCSVILVELEDGGTFHPLVGVQRIGRNVLPLSQKRL